MNYKSTFFILMSGFAFFLSCKDDECNSAPAINAGRDTVIINSDTLSLHATTDGNNGTWNIIAGSQGNIEDPKKADTKFSGQLNTRYSLVWTSDNDCGSSKDTLNIEFRKQLSADQMVENMHWIVQSAYKIVAGGLKIYIDPIGIKTKDTADYILITHSHDDHYLPSDIAKLATAKTVIIGPSSVKYTGVCKEYKTVKPGDELNISEYFSIKAVHSYNIVKSYHPKAANNVGYLVNLEGVVIYHAGDTERIPEMKDFSCDIALVPLGQTYTMSKVSEAVDAVKDVKAKIAIPMHYGYAEGTATDAKNFIDMLEGTGIKGVLKVKGE